MPSQAYDPAKINVAVIGGGIGGLTTAIGILKYPHLNVQIYEAAHHFGEIGAGIAMGPNAQRGLKLISPETEQAFLNVATNNGWEKYQKTWFEFYYGQGERAGEYILTANNDTGNKSLHRAKFLDELVKLVPEGISHFGKRLVDIEEAKGSDDSGKPGVLTLKFKEGEDAKADVVIGADGVHSGVRHHLYGELYEPMFANAVVYRGIPSMKQAKEVLGDERAENSFQYLGYGKSLICNPIDHGDILNIVAVDYTKSIWDGPWVVPVAGDVVRDAFKDFDEYSRKLVDLVVTSTDVPQTWAMWDLPPLPSFVKPSSRIGLMGDAAHASTPFQGQGAGQAIEDAHVLHVLFGNITKVEQVPALLEAYDVIRRPRAQHCVASSREAGSMSALRLQGVGDDPDKLREKITTRMKWIWEIDLEHQAQNAVDEFHRLVREGGS